MFRKNQTLKGKMIIWVMAMIAAILFLIMSISIGLFKISHLNQLINDENEQMNKFYLAEAALYDWSNQLNSAINYGDDKSGVSEYDCKFKQFMNSESKEQNKEIKEFEQKTENARNNIQLSTKTILLDLNKNKEHAIETYRNITQPNIEILISETDKFISLKKDTIEKYQEKYNEIKGIAVALCGISLLLIIGLIIFLFYLLNKEIICNLFILKKGMDELSKGNLKHTVEIKSKILEILEVAETYNFCVKELEKYVSAIDYGMSEFSKGNFTCKCPIAFVGDFAHIQEAIEDFQSNMNDMLVELNMTSMLVSTEASQVSYGAQALAQGSAEQANSVDKISLSITEILHQISLTVEFLESANTIGKQSGEIVQKSQEEMKNMMRAINDILSASENIQRITKIINDIAFRTNILALTATVEAARAGTAGKGFAVVANEVRNLAQKSSQAAKDTTELIGKTLQSVIYGEELATSTDAAFNEVAKYSKEILEMMSKITKASNGQESSIAQLASEVEQISSVIQTNSATSEESAAASEELSGQAELMRSLVSRFQVKID